LTKLIPSIGVLSALEEELEAGRKMGKADSWLIASWSFGQHRERTICAPRARRD
jgi:hypothetical protein